MPCKKKINDSNVVSCFTNCNERPNCKLLAAYLAAPDQPKKVTRSAKPHSDEVVRFGSAKIARVRTYTNRTHLGPGRTNWRDACSRCGSTLDINDNCPTCL